MRGGTRLIHVPMVDEIIDHSLLMEAVLAIRSGGDELVVLDARVVRVLQHPGALRSWGGVASAIDVAVEGHSVHVRLGAAIGLSERSINLAVSVRSAAGGAGVSSLPGVVRVDAGVVDVLAVEHLVQRALHGVVALAERSEVVWVVAGAIPATFDASIPLVGAHELLVGVFARVVKIASQDERVHSRGHGMNIATERSLLLLASLHASMVGEPTHGGQMGVIAAVVNVAS
mmetsp:Transcript_26936/g.58623  ORF Transcript_26936/g.58623 Transcript_26936/m.58623 type:complete len:230 (+) Transcript_26936:1373-2062(+)